LATNALFAAQPSGRSHCANSEREARAKSVSLEDRWILAMIATVETDGAIDGELAAIAEVLS
jgi:hypothetical protein